MKIPVAMNWEESINLQPSVIVKPRNEKEIQEIINKPSEYPSPVRASGSRHSTTKCTVADGGTLVDMRNMDRVLEIKDEIVRLEAGILFVDAAQELKKYGLQFFVNVEIGNITMGSAATCGTKDASFPGEYGQMASYVKEVKMVNGQGELIVIDETTPELMRAFRSSYGLMGIVYEVSFKVKKIQPLKVYHKTFSLSEFEYIHPQLCQAKESLMFYLFPYEDKITIEYREYVKGSSKFINNSYVWRFRNYVWKKFAPSAGYILMKICPTKKMAYKLIDKLNVLIRYCLVKVIKSSRTNASDQIIRYPEKKGISKYTFSIWAFPESDYPRILRAYFDFCKEYYKNTSYRTDILNVGYKIDFDQNPLFSYSFDGPVMTADPVSTGGAGWDDFLKAYNEFCVKNNGIPMFNQSKHLNRDLVKAAFNPERIKDFNEHRQHCDPEKRFLNDYFKTLFDIP